MSVRRFIVTLWPHTTETSAVIVLEDTSGRRRVVGGIGRVNVPIGIADFHGEPMPQVLAALGLALTALGSPHPPEGGPAPLEGPQGGIPGQEELPLNLT